MTSSGNGKQTYNPFHRMDEQPVQPPFLVRDTQPKTVIERHRQRMANHPAGPVNIAIPQRSAVAVRGKAALGLGFDQQEALIDALTGVYAEKYWRDMWGRLYKRWGLGEVLDTILIDGAAQPDRVCRVLSPLLFSLSPDIDEEARALRRRELPVRPARRLRRHRRPHQDFAHRTRRRYRFVHPLARPL